MAITLKDLQKTEQYQNSPEFFDWMLEQLIDPLKTKGYELQRYHEDHDPETAMGVHIFTFEGREYLTPEFLESLMFQDDSQPRSSYNNWFGTLWIFIPYGG